MRWTLLAAAAVAVLSLSGGSGGGAGPRVELVAGSLSLVNSLEGQAVFSTDNLGPGHSAGGTVTVANTGTLPGALSLAQSAPTGSALAGQLRLAVRDLTVGTTVYSGPLTGLGTVSLGTLGAGAARVYGFTATLPASAGDAGQSDSTEVAYTWTATETTVAPPPAPPSAPPSSPGGPDLRKALRLRVRVPGGQKVASRGRVVAFARCNQACWLSGRARLLGARTRVARSGRVAAGRQKPLVLKLGQRTLKRLRRTRHPTRIRITVTARTSTGTRQTVNKRARIAPKRHQRQHPESGHVPNSRCAAARC